MSLTRRTFDKMLEKHKDTGAPARPTLAFPFELLTIGARRALCGVLRAVVRPLQAPGPSL